VTRKADREPRSTGSIRRRGNSLQVNVYAGVDPLTGRRLYLSESTTDEAEAKRILNKFRAEVDEKRNAHTRALFRVAIEEWLTVHELEDTTREGYEMYARRYINPALGDEPVSTISARLLEQFYAELRRCRTRCDGRPAIDHREDGPHECRIVKHKRPPGRPPAGGYPDHDCTKAGCTVTECPPHQCRPLSNATISKLHFIMRGALSAACAGSGSPATPPR
jgi:integrase